MSRLASQNWTYMFLAIRLLALLTFTAHAVLGCCLSHGSCSLDQEAMLELHCCEHAEHACEVDYDHQCSEDGSQQAAHEHTHDGSCEATDQGHSEHCDHAHCIFGLNVDSGQPSLWLVQYWAVWDYVLTDAQLNPSRKCRNVEASLHRSPHELCNRSVLQVWLI